jgi:hypothetical protein
VDDHCGVSGAAPPPRRPALRLWPVLRDLLALRARSWVFAAPGAAFVAGYALSIEALGPSFDDGFVSRYEQFFSTSAQVIAGALIALALEAGVFGASGQPLARRAASLAFVYVVVGEAAAITALAPDHDVTTYEQAFRLTVAALCAVLVALAFVAIYGVRSRSARAEADARKALGLHG